MNCPDHTIERKYKGWQRPSLLTYVAVVCLSVFGGIVADPARLYAQDSPLIYDGFTEPIHDVLVAANEIGRVDQVLVAEGDHVRKGETVARLEDAVQAASVRISEMQCRMTGEIEAAKAELATSRRRAEQLRELADERMAPPTEVARAEADLQIAQARLHTVLESIELKKLELERYRVQLERRRVFAPMDGIVADVFHQPGEYVTPGDPALIRLLVTRQLYAVFNVPVDELATCKVGSVTRVFLRGSGTNVKAKVCYVAPSIDGESGTVRVRVLIPNEDEKLRAGDRCTVTVISSHSSSLSQNASVKFGAPVRSAKLGIERLTVDPSQQSGGRIK